MTNPWLSPKMAYQGSTVRYPFHSPRRGRGSTFGALSVQVSSSLMGEVMFLLPVDFQGPVLLRSLELQLGEEQCDLTFLSLDTFCLKILDWSLVCLEALPTNVIFCLRLDSTGSESKIKPAPRPRGIRSTKKGHAGRGRTSSCCCQVGTSG